MDSAGNIYVVDEGQPGSSSSIAVLLHGDDRSSGPDFLHYRNGTALQIVMKVFSFARTSCATAAGTTAPA